MPTSPVPYVHPNEITFGTSQTLPQTQQFCIFNPFAQDILFKVDCPAKHILASPVQGVVSSRKKINVELTCTSWVITQGLGVQVRFYKWAKPRHGQKGSAQHYIGYREVKVKVSTDRSERERTPSDWESVSLGASSPPGGSHRPSQGSSRGGPLSDVGSVSQEGWGPGRQVHVVSNILLALVLLVCGLVLSHTSEEWFSTHVLESIKPQTLAVISYTLVGIIVISLLTLR